MKTYNLCSVPLMLLIAIVLFTSCSELLDIEPINPQLDTDFVQDEVFNKVYLSLAMPGNKGPHGSPDFSVVGSNEDKIAFIRPLYCMQIFPTDISLCAWTDPAIMEFQANNWTSSNEYIEGMYSRLTYNYTLCNHFLERTNGATDEKTIRQRSEVRFHRALNYYYLMDLYGNPPFSTVVSSDFPPQISRTDLYEFIEDELLDILEPENNMYEPKAGPYGRVDKAGVWLLLSRMYLNAEVYTGTSNWAGAKEYANKILDSSYELCQNYSHLFMADNDENLDAVNEIIFPIRQDGVMTTNWSGTMFIVCMTRTSGMRPWGSANPWSGARARKTLVSKFFPNEADIPAGGAMEEDMVAAANDDRALFYSGGYSSEDQVRSLSIADEFNFYDGFSMVKWTNIRSDNGETSDPSQVDVDVPFFRMAEAYLTYAEAALRNGDDVQDAMDKVNALRNRANAESVQLSDFDLDYILDERAREYYLEAHRRTDLIRFGYFTTNAYHWDWKKHKPDGDQSHVDVSFDQDTDGDGKPDYWLFPIPLFDINANPNLEQNPGF